MEYVIYLVYLNYKAGMSDIFMDHSFYNNTMRSIWWKPFHIHYFYHTKIGIFKQTDFMNKNVKYMFSLISNAENSKLLANGKESMLIVKFWIPLILQP